MSTVRVFKYSMGWSWTCSSCGIGYWVAQWSVWDKQPAALAAALLHCTARSALPVVPERTEQ